MFILSNSILPISLCLGFIIWAGHQIRMHYGNVEDVRDFSQRHLAIYIPVLGANMTWEIMWHLLVYNLKTVAHRLTSYLNSIRTNNLYTLFIYDDTILASF